MRNITVECHQDTFYNRVAASLGAILVSVHLHSAGCCVCARCVHRVCVPCVYCVCTVCVYRNCSVCLLCVHRMCSVCAAYVILHSVGARLLYVRGAFSSALFSSFQHLDQHFSTTQQHLLPLLCHFV